MRTGRSSSTRRSSPQRADRRHRHGQAAPRPGGRPVSFSPSIGPSVGLPGSWERRGASPVTGAADLRPTGWRVVWRCKPCARRRSSGGHPVSMQRTGSRAIVRRAVRAPDTPPISRGYPGRIPCRCIWPLSAWLSCTGVPWRCSGRSSQVVWSASRVDAAGQSAPGCPGCGPCRASPRRQRRICSHRGRPTFSRLVAASCVRHAIGPDPAPIR